MDSPSEMVREAAYKMYYWEEESQEGLLTSILADRSELGRLCACPIGPDRILVPEGLSRLPSIDCPGTPVPGEDPQGVVL